MQSMFARRLFGVAGTAALLAACSSATQQSALSSSASSSAVRGGIPAIANVVSPVAIPGPVGVSPTRGRSWVNPAARRESLLYVTNYYNGTVNMYTFQNGRGSLELQGTIYGVTKPTQPCTDASNNVFIPSETEGLTREYAHAGVEAIQTLRAGGTGCSVDRATGNLAVADFGLGTVSVFPHATGTPTTYSWATTAYPEFVAYDNTSDLYIEGQTAGGGGGVLGVIPNGASSITDLTLSGFSIKFAGQILWGGTWLLVGDQGPPPYINQASISGTTVSLHAILPYQEPVNDVIVGYWRTGAVPNARVSAADFEGNNVQIDEFPSMTVLVNASNGVNNPFGVTVSR